MNELSNGHDDTDDQEQASETGDIPLAECEYTVEQRLRCDACDFHTYNPESFETYVRAKNEKDDRQHRSDDPDTYLVVESQPFG